MRTIPNNEEAKPKRKPGFQPGQSGNPSGRPRKTEEQLKLVEMCKERTPEALGTILEIMQAGENERNRLSAAQYVLDRGWGKPVQATEVTGKDGGPLEIVRIELVPLTSDDASSTPAA